MQHSRGLLIALGVLVLVLLLTPMLGGGMMGPGMMGGYGPQGSIPPGVSGWGWGLGMALGMVGMLAFWGALLVGLVLLIRAAVATGSVPPGTGGEAPLDVLRRRYAAGEITQEQYEQMRRVLEQ